MKDTSPTLHERYQYHSHIIAEVRMTSYPSGRGRVGILDVSLLLTFAGSFPICVDLLHANAGLILT